jgi:predicted Zn-dependent peptidase
MIDPTVLPRPAVDVGALDNGLDVVVVPLPHLHVASVVLFVRVGSRFETPATNGLSHLLEHVLFRGCETYPDTYALNSAIERVASGIDAATSRDFTTFEASCVPQRVPDVLALMGAMFSAPCLRAEDLAIEQRIIHEELQDELDARGRDIDVDNIAKRLLFGESSIGLKVGGPLSRVRQFTVDDLRAWFARHYVALNMVLVVSGPVEPAATRAAAALTFGALPAGGPAAPTPAPVVASLPEFHHTPHDGSQVDVQLQWVLPPEGDPDWPALSMIQRLLDDGTCARLRHRLVDQLGLAYHASADLESHDGLSILSLHTQTRQAQVVAAVDAMLAIVDELAASPPSADEFERVRGRLALELSSVRDSTSATAFWFGLERLLPGLDGLAVRLARAAAVGAEAIPEAAARHLGRASLLLTVVGDLDPVVRAALRRRVRGGRTPSA